MKRWIPIAIVLILAVGGLAFVLMRGSDEQPASSSTGAQETNTDTSADSVTTPAETVTDDSAADAAHLRGANLGETVDATDQTTVTVAMKDFKFDITTLTIKKGTTVKWVNEGSHGHRITSVNSSPQKFTSSGLLGNGDTHEVTFTTSGTYYYQCAEHPDEMRAIIKVVD